MNAVPRSFMVEVSSELLAELIGEWSEPVQIQVTEDGRGGYSLVCRRLTHDLDNDAWLASQGGGV
jgi:hypothetical protein